MAAGVNNVAVVGWAGRGPISCSESCILGFSNFNIHEQLYNDIHNVQRNVLLVLSQDPIIMYLNMVYPPLR